MSAKSVKIAAMRAMTVRWSRQSWPSRIICLSLLHQVEVIARSKAMQNQWKIPPDDPKAIKNNSSEGGETPKTPIIAEVRFTYCTTENSENCTHKSSKNRAMSVFVERLSEMPTSRHRSIWSPSCTLVLCRSRSRSARAVAFSASSWYAFGRTMIKLKDKE